MGKAYVVSTFDMVNVADLDLLRQVRKAAEEVTVMVLGDAEATRLHGRAPVIPEQERFGLVDALRETTEVKLIHALSELPPKGPQHTIYTDEEELADVADILVMPWRRSSSPQLRAALDHGHADHTARRDEGLSA